MASRKSLKHNTETTRPDDSPTHIYKHARTQLTPQQKCMAPIPFFIILILIEFVPDSRTICSIDKQFEI